MNKHTEIEERLNKMLFELKNGITLCKDCHSNTIGKEKQFIEYFKNKIGDKF